MSLPFVLFCKSLILFIVEDVKEDISIIFQYVFSFTILTELAISETVDTTELDRLVLTKSMLSLLEI